MAKREDTGLASIDLIRGNKECSDSSDRKGVNVVEQVADVGRLPGNSRGFHSFALSVESLLLCHGDPQVSVPSHLVTTHYFAVQTVFKIQFVRRTASDLHLCADADLDVRSVDRAEERRNGVQHLGEDPFRIEGDQGGDGSTLDPLDKVQTLLFGVRHLQSDRCDSFDGKAQLRVMRQVHPKAETLGESQNVDRVARKAVVEEGERLFDLPIVEREGGVAVFGKLLDVQFALQMAAYGVKHRQRVSLRIQIRWQMV